MHIGFALHAVHIIKQFKFLCKINNSGLLKFYEHPHIVKKKHTTRESACSQKRGLL
jgi:hypothetical protein